MSPSQIIVLAAPVILPLIALGFAWGYARGRNTYRLAGGACSFLLSDTLLARNLLAKP